MREARSARLACTNSPFLVLFNSLQFCVFFPVVTALYFLAPHRIRWLLLLVASCVFYAAFIPKYLLILFFLILVDYSAGILIENAAGARRRARCS